MIFNNQTKLEMSNKNQAKGDQDPPKLFYKSEGEMKDYVENALTAKIGKLENRWTLWRIFLGIIFIGDKEGTMDNIFK